LALTLIAKNDGSVRHLCTPSTQFNLNLFLLRVIERQRDWRLRYTAAPFIVRG